MTTEKNFKKLVRSRMRKTGESYAAARAALVAPSPPAPLQPFILPPRPPAVVPPPDQVVIRVGESSPLSRAIGDAVAGLLVALVDDDANVRRNAVRSLRKIAEQHFLKTRLSGASFDAVLAKRREEAVAASIRLLVDSSIETRQEAARLLGLIGDREAIPALLSLLTNEADESTRSWVAVALGIMGEVSALDRLMALLSEGTELFRFFAALTLGHLRDDRGSEGLVRALSDASSAVRREAAWALRALEDPSTIPALRLVARSDEDQTVRNNAIGALGRFRGPEIVDVLIEALTDDYSKTRWNAAKGLGKMGDQRAIGPLATVVARDPDPGVRAIASWSIGRLTT